jgi:hypothetical protein
MIPFVAATLPTGQALCKRTMTAIERLNETHAEKLMYYMSKADQAGGLL